MDAGVNGNVKDQRRALCAVVNPGLPNLDLCRPAANVRRTGDWFAMLDPYNAGWSKRRGGSAAPAAAAAATPAI